MNYEIIYMDAECSVIATLYQNCEDLRHAMQWAMNTLASEPDLKDAVNISITVEE